MIKIIKQLVSKTEPVYFALSMGVDSVAAYYWMRNKGYNVTPIHFNHKLRPQNDKMEQQYKMLCHATNQKPIIGYGDNLNTENNCRQARLDFYNNFTNSTILTAHHLNDAVESYLLNCFRGKPNHDPIKLSNNFINYTIVHPFLLTKKSDFIQYAERNDLYRFIVTDETNNQLKGSRRNWIRNNIIPEMTNQKLCLEKYAKKQITGLIENCFAV